ncbi:TerC family protein [Paenisporosarcina cavernae]|uniref:TerC family protein n=1 Tax=Paenisporosarcina cavernae TaxID=2320858 RepID=A0A385YU13_9BACL|nr:TerC family protein [Paenisporosarcina cavernae]AYC29052.1 TerC family protein [Paenisporosarcina cavernae]
MADIFTWSFLVALASIVVIDLVLAGDNAIVIGMSAKNLPVHQRKKAIIIGTVGAVIVRILATLAIVWLLKIPGLQLVGGLILIWIAYKLLVEDNEIGDHKASKSLASAVATIMIADTVMGLDNVLAVAGAANHNYTLVVLGLLISVPIMVWGSTMFIKLIDKFPIIIYIGSAVLAFTAARMITHEPFLHDFFTSYWYLSWLFIAVVVVAVVFIGRKKSQALESTAHEMEHPTH